MSPLTSLKLLDGSRLYHADILDTNSVVNWTNIVSTTASVVFIIGYLSSILLLRYRRKPWPCRSLANQSEGKKLMKIYAVSFSTGNTPIT